MKNHYTFFYLFKQLNQWKEISLFKANNNRFFFSKNNYLLSGLLFFIFLSFTASKVNAQIVLIDSSSVLTSTTNISTIANGGFGAVGASTTAVSSFTANGFTLSNTTSGSFWVVGTTPGAYSASGGGRCAFISTSNTSTSAFAYSASQNRTAYFYRDITFPSTSSGVTSINLFFYWKGGGDANDKATVYLTPTSYTPVAATSTTSIPSTTYTPLWTQTAGQNTYTAVSISIPTTTNVLGTTQRLIFAWQNDNTIATAPSIAIDCISLLCITPSCSNTPVAATASISSPGGCASAANVTLTANNVDPTSGLTHQWQSSTDGGATWGNTLVSNSTYTNTTAGTTMYRYVSACGSSSVASNVVSYTAGTCSVTIDMLDASAGWNGASVDFVINGSTFLNC